MATTKHEHAGTGGEPAHDPVDFEPATEFGGKLKALRAEIIKAGIPLLDDEELERGIAERRGSRDAVTEDADVR